MSPTNKLFFNARSPSAAMHSRNDLSAVTVCSQVRKIRPRIMDNECGGKGFSCVYGTTQSFLVSVMSDQQYGFVFTLQGRNGRDIDIPMGQPREYASQGETTVAAPESSVPAI